MNLDHANNLIEKALEKARLLQVSVTITIVDSSGYLICLKRMDKALLGSIDIAIRKAKTSALFQKSTHVLGEKSLPGKPLFGIENSNNGLITFAGGLPIYTNKHEFIGAIGVSGSTIENDLTIAKSGLS